MIKYLNLFKSIFFLMLFALLFAFTKNRSNRKESNLVMINNTQQEYVKNKNIKDFINNNNTLLFKKQLSKIDLSEIERKLNNFNFIKKSDVYFLPNGKIYFNVIEESPILRIKTSTKEFYLTKENSVINLSSIFTPDVLIIEGDIKKAEHKKLIKLYNYINDDNLLKTHIVGIKKGGKNFYIFKTNMQHSIEFGSLNKINEKFNNLKLFYSEYLSKQTQEKYKKIILRFNNQVVASK